ncbi:MAG TPA: M3 family oligoendopeptidase [Anaerolineaceae bacterium]|nr:M3 family oligoendopeptidase [Anaerolineaceae bacterium]
MTGLPETPQELMTWDWPQFQPFAQHLADVKINSQNVEQWLRDWSLLDECVDELYNRLEVAITVNTADKDAESRFNHFMDTIYPKMMASDQGLKLKLLESGLVPAGFAIPLRNYRAEAKLFNADNLPLLAEEQKLSNEYNQIISAMTVPWQGRELTISQLEAVYQNLERDTREQAWRLAAERQLADRQAINELWQKLLALRLKLAANSGLPDYRAFRWQQLLRFDYTPADCKSFHDAIEQVAVPAASRIYDRRRQQLGLQTLRPWDLNVDPLGRSPLQPFKDVRQLEEKVSNVFHQVHPELGAYFDIMIQENLLDLDNRKNKAPGGYCTGFNLVHRPFIFANVVGTHRDVQTMLHEGGHSFHVFETAGMSYFGQLSVPAEFAEVASMAMELLASPYLANDYGGFYTKEEAARAGIEQLEQIITFWPYMAVVDAFQHWVYENPPKAKNADQCDAEWGALWQRFMPGVDWSGLEDTILTGWHKKPHIHTSPFYYVEYGLAQLAAVQVWENALRDQTSAVARYRKALSLGGTETVPRLYQTAGAKLAFDADTLKKAISLLETKIQELGSNGNNL